MKQIIILSLLFGLMVSPAGVPSCDQIANTVISMTEESNQPAALSTQEIVEGLKTALRVGTDSSVFATSRINGFYRDEAIKILLPPEAAVLYEYKDKPLVRAIGLDQKIEDAILALNRAAEDAAKEAGPIFKNAISGMSITDGMSILKGINPANPVRSQAFDSTAATQYLIYTTRIQLRDAFSPVVNASLDKKLLGNYSPNQIWNTLSTSYNGVANKSLGMIKPMGNTDLGAYVTEKALDGLFLKVAEEEIIIRRDPLSWARTSVGKILERVFGSRL